MIDPITILRAEEAGLPATESHPDPPLVCFPLRTDWEGTLPVGLREPFPAPALPSRQSRALTFPTPSAVLALAEYAREQSWEVRTQYSQGHVPHGTTGKPSALKDMIALRFGRHPMTDRQAYAVYSRNASGGTWTWTSVMIWGPDLPPYGGCGITEIKAYLTLCADTDSVAMGMWVRDLKEIRRNAEVLRKARAKAAPKKSGTKEGLS